MAGFLQLDELRLDYEGLYVLFLTVAAFLMPMILVFPPVPPQRSDALLQTHSRAGLRPSESNLRDQFKSKFKSKSKSGAESAQGPKARVQSLHIYPVKSCRGIEVRQAKVLPTGLEFDRIYMFAQLRSQFPAPVEAASGDVTKDAHAWQFLTQRQFPRLATVKVDLWLPDEEKLRRQGLLGPGGAADEEAFLVLRFPWRDRGWRGVLQALGAKLAHRSPFAVPEREILLPTSCPPTEEIRAKGYEFEDVRIWRDTVAALNMEKELPEELRLYLGVSNRLGLFRVDPARLREVYRCAPKRVEAGYQPVTGFQDAVSFAPTPYCAWFARPELRLRVLVVVDASSKSARVLISLVSSNFEAVDANPQHKQYPLHIMNLSSVKEFSSHVPKDETLKELEVRRFRPNIIGKRIHQPTH